MTAEEKKQYFRDYYLKNKDKFRERNAISYLKNKDKYKGVYNNRKKGYMANQWIGMFRGKSFIS